MTKINITPNTDRPASPMQTSTWRAALGPGFANGLTQNTTNLLAKSSATNARRY